MSKEYLLYSKTMKQCMANDWLVDIKVNNFTKDDNSKLLSEKKLNNGAFYIRRIITGFALNWTSKLTLINLLDDNFYQNGYVLIPDSMIIGHRYYNKNRDREFQVAKYLGFKPNPLNFKLDMKSLPKALASLGSQVPLITVYSPNIEGGPITTGMIYEIKKNKCRILEFSWSMDKVAGFIDIYYDEISHIIFDSSYEKVFWTVVSNRFMNQIVPFNPPFLKESAM